MKNAETFLNQHNPTLAMIEFEQARFLRNFMRVKFPFIFINLK